MPRTLLGARPPRLASASGGGDELAAHLASENPELGHGALLIARESIPGLSLPEELARLAELAAALRRRLAEVVGGRRQIQAFNRFLFGELRLEASNARDLDSLLPDLLLPEVLRRRRGHCLGLSTLALALAERVGLPIRGVSVPGHFFCRYEDSKERINIELTLAGAEWSDERYIAERRPSPEALARGLALSSLEVRDVLAEILNNRGHYHWRRGLQDEAVHDLYRATRSSRRFSRGHAAKGFMALCRGHFDLAVLELGRSLEIDPGSPRACLHLGEALLEQDQGTRALELLSRAAELAPDCAAAHSILGRAHARLGDATAARHAHERALALDPDSGLAWNNYGVFLASAGSGEDAINAFVQALERGSDLIAAAENLGLLAARGRLGAHGWILDELIASYTERLAAAPDDRRAALALARLLIALGRDAPQARALALLAYRARRDSVACELLAALAFQDQEFGQARRLAREGIALLPGAHSRRHLLRLIARIERALHVPFDAPPERVPDPASST